MGVPVGTTFSDCLGTYTVVSEPYDGVEGPVQDVRNPQGWDVAMYVEAITYIVEDQS